MDVDEIAGRAGDPGGDHLVAITVADRSQRRHELGPLGDTRHLLAEDLGAIVGLEPALLSLEASDLVFG